MLHALLHISGWIAHGFPTATDAAISEVVAVVLVSALGFVLAWVNARKQGVV